MTLADIILLLVIVSIVAAVVIYIVKQKKRGARCIGCSSCSCDDKKKDCNSNDN